MDLEILLKTRAFLEEISISIRNILLAQFPGMTEEEREDLDNEVKLKLWRKISCGKNIANLRSYLWRVVYTTALDILGERPAQTSVEELMETGRCEENLPQDMSSPSSALEEKEFQALVEKAMEILPERRKAVLQLHFSGMNLKQIAESLNWRENQVRHLLYRGLTDLRETIEKWQT